MALENDAQKHRKAEDKRKEEHRKSTARANGAKSTGPASEQGRDNISQANTRHGMKRRRCDSLLLACEDPAKLHELTFSYYEHIRPSNAAEASLVDLLVASIWRGARLLSYEAELLTDKAEDLHPTLAETYESISSNRLFALAFEAINGKGSANPMINRYLTSTRNSYHSALTDIERLRKIKGDPDTPYYMPTMPKEVPTWNLEFSKPQPQPEPMPEPVPEPVPVPEPAPQPEPQPQPQPEPPPVPPAPHPLLARAVPNPDAPLDPNTIWVHIIGSDGKVILDNNDRPILKPIHIGPKKPALPATPATPAESTESRQSPKPEPTNQWGFVVPDDLRTGN